MPSFLKNLQKPIHIVTLVILAFIVCIGAVMVLVQIKPFWVDEWFIIYSLKTKDVAGIFGQLAFMQQFPRVYLALLKLFSSFFNYSYFSLRLPSYLVSTSVILVCYSVMRKIFDVQIFTRYLFVMILVSSFTYTEYFVEMKQYPMDILLSVFALWQLIEILSLQEHKPIKYGRYFLLCLSFLIVPFFSYTYPIAIAPAYVVVLLQTTALFKGNDEPSVKWKTSIQQWIPLVIGMVGIILFYLIDARHLATDKIMYDRWSFLIIDKDNKVVSFFRNFYVLFSQVGAGLLFETLFGVLGVVSFLYGIVVVVKKYVKGQNGLEDKLRMYSCMLLVFTLILFLCKKMPLGTPRLNAFTVPAIAILIIYFFNSMLSNTSNSLLKTILPLILFLGVTGNVYVWYINYFTSARYKKQISIYRATERVINLAQAKGWPVLIAPGIAYPYERAVVDAGAPDPAVWVLKTFPAYDMNKHLAVYAIPDTIITPEYAASLPANTDTVLVGDGSSYRTYSIKNNKQH